MSQGDPRAMEREELLRAAALGTLDARAPDVAARLRADPELAHEVEELGRAREAAQRVLRLGAELTNRAASAAVEEDRQLVERVFTDLARRKAPPRPRPRAYLFAGIGLAAALALVFFLVWKGGKRAPLDVLLDGNGEVTLEVAPRSGGIGSLLWNVTLAPGDRLELRCYAEHDGRRGELLLGPLSVDADGWTPSEEEERRLPAVFRAELVRVDSQGPRLLGWKRVSRSP